MTRRCTLPSTTDAVAASRLIEWRELAALAEIALPIPREEDSVGGPPRVVYLLPRTASEGASSALFDQARGLADLGAEVTLVSHFPAPEDVGVCGEYREVPFGEPLADAVPPCDVVVAGHWEFILPARQLAIAPVLHFEHGDFHLYDEVPMALRTLLEASLSGAHATFAAGILTADLLESRFGVPARPVAVSVDLRTFQPSPRRSDGTPRSVVLAGWDGFPADRLDDAHRVVRDLMEDDPDLRIRWMTPHPPARESIGEVLVAPTAYERARALEQADLLLHTSCFGGYPRQPLEAMACGVPVVAITSKGLCSYARDGYNALLAPAGQPEALVEAARRVLEDPRLVQVLRAGGLETAHHHAGPRVCRELLGAYESAARRAGHARRNPRFRVDLDDLSFVHNGDEERFARRLRSCPNAALALPVSQPVLDDLRVVRWRVVARRHGGVPTTARVYLPVRSEAPLEDSPEQVGIELLRTGRAEGGVEWFLERCAGKGGGPLVTVGRWVVLALLAAGRPGEAIEVAGAFAHDFPAHPDYRYLYVRAALAAGLPVEVGETLESLRLLGNGARFEEWFDEPHALLADCLVA